MSWQCQTLWSSCQTLHTIDYFAENISNLLCSLLFDVFADWIMTNHAHIMATPAYYDVLYCVA